MQSLFDFHEILLANTSAYKRYLLNKIDWSNRLIAIKGARGSGKTTILLQQIKYNLTSKDVALYTSLDDLYFLENTLVSLAKEFVQQGGTHLFLDEVHKYPSWSREIKLIYDQFPKLKTVFTSSSMLEIYKGESDLSRRAVSYFLKELSFREFIYFEKQIKLPTYSLEEILKNHKEIAREINLKLPTPIKEFKNYLEYGNYPYFLENKKSYLIKLTQTIQLILESDLSAIENMTFEDSRKIKKLLVAIAQSVPFTPNISKLSERLGMSRVFLINAIKLLNRADLVMELYKPTKGIGALTKPEKLYLNNTNLIYALAPKQAEIGTLRETFFANQMKHIHEIHLAEKGDFIVNKKYTFEIGGKNKPTKQIKGIENSFVVRDDMEVGGLNIIPLFVFGFMY
ncbi:MULTISPECIES: ATP-binding protein [unclassified Polaribacter]|uniref:ATP-binding protein n=1 Tax=unclassified Polaribacter TaxID=196858 RepID=UPI0011BEEA14|nr:MULTISPECIES: AAA family ATPase [unclassified Polaribacter]TXD50173.1 ATP-binding protein [Polaribacter sp. IC063]TXD56239.1 ATP-binding protein [Polaribacter sp. IC066]